MSQAQQELGLGRVKEVTAERAKVISAFNEFYYAAFRKSMEPGHSRFFRTIKAGVERAIGGEIEDPKYAIPPYYKGDGSFEISFQISTGQTITRRESISLPFFSDFSRYPFYQTLLNHSAPFKLLHPAFYHGRVSLEAYYLSLDRSSEETRSNPKSDYEFAEWDLRARRELILPVVPAA